MAAPHKATVRVARIPHRRSFAGLAGLLLVALCLALSLPQDHTPFVNAPVPTHSKSKATLSALDTRYEEDEVVEDWQLTYKGLDLDGDKLDNLDQWYEETTSGDGGEPDGFIRDLILRSYFGGNFDEKQDIVMDRDYTGPNKQPSDADYRSALETFKKEAKSGAHFKGGDDKQGWIWLAARQKPNGLWLYMDKAPPYGERALAIMKESNVDEFFEKVDWHMLYIRLYKPNLWGGKVKKFTFPIKGRADYR